MRLYAVRCNHDVLLMPISGLSNATTYTVLCHFSVQKHPPDYSYSACLILCLYFLALICLHQNGMTDLMVASRLGHITMVDFLLTKGANTDAQDEVCYAVSLQYPLRQNKQVVEYCIAAATYDVTDSGVQ